MNRLKSAKFVSTYFVALAFAAALQASATVITFVTPTGATTGGGPVNASATFTTGAGTLFISLTDLQANPTDVAQLISDLDFTLSGGQTTGTLSSSSGTQINVAGNGTFALGSTGSTGWGLNNNVAGGLQLDALGFIGPAGLIIGPPGAGGTYSNANGSIAGNGPHNPFLNQTATFSLLIAGLNADSIITSATFSFGTVPGINVPGIPQLPGGKIPEPASIALLGIGLLAFGASRRSRKA
jgi:hypothetical protein